MFQTKLVVLAVVSVVFVFSPSSILFAQYNPNGWIQTNGWCYLMPLNNNNGCFGGGEELMNQNWIAPHNIGEENPMPAENWDNIDYSNSAVSSGFMQNCTSDVPVWLSNNIIYSTFNKTPPNSDNVWFNHQGMGIYEWFNNEICNGLEDPFVFEFQLHLATTYVRNLSDHPLEIELCTASDDSMQVWINSSRVLTKSICRDMMQDMSCQETTAIMLPTGLSKIAVLVWQGVGGCGFRLGLKRNGVILSDGNEYIEFIGFMSRLKVVVCPETITSIPITIRNDNGEIIEENIMTPIERLYNVNETITLEAPEYFNEWKFKCWIVTETSNNEFNCWNCQQPSSRYRTVALNSVVFAKAQYIPTTPNIPPQITHTPITSARKGQNLWFEFDVTDDKDQIESITLWVKLSSLTEYTPFPFAVHNDSPHYVIDLTGLTDTLDSVDYYIEAKDMQGATATTLVYRINIVDKWPVIIIPGVMGSELVDTDTGDKIWLDEKVLIPKDYWLLKLMLQTNGINPDENHRCADNLNQICTIERCGATDECFPGGRPINVSSVLSFNVVGIGFYDAYNKLVKRLSDNGYQDNVFTFPYDWRLDLQASAELLKVKIDEIRLSTGLSKVNIIAHSLGGLVARTYIQQHLDNHCLDTLIFLGTPHRGSPMAYAILEGYKPLLSEFRNIWPKDLNWWLELNTQTFVSQNFPTAYQTLPRYGYIKKGNEFESYSLSNEALRNNNDKLLDKAIVFFNLIEEPYPEDIKYYSILGTALPTLNGFVFKDGKCKGPTIDFWADGSIPNNSSTWFGLDQEYFVKTSHMNLPGNITAQEKILNILQGNPDAPVTGIYSSPQKFTDESGVWKKFKKLTACCPIDLKISTPNGDIIGIDNDGTIKEQIPNSEFFKFEENESGYFPDGEYVIEIRGKGFGEFTLVLETLDDNDVIVSVAEYTNIPVADVSRGIILLTENDLSPRLFYDVDGDNVDDFILNPGEEAPEDLKYYFAERGDINLDRELDISDAVNILAYLFSGAKADCAPAGYVNADNAIDISDAVYLLSYLFLGTQKKPEGLILCR